MKQNLEPYTADYYQRPLVEYQYNKLGLLRPDQYAAVCHLYDLPLLECKRGPLLRDPGLIVSIGCGEGYLEKWLELRGHVVIGVDPSPGAKELYQGRTLVPRYGKKGVGDTILFVESLEHIPLDEIREMWSLFPVGARVIITNWLLLHPIKADSDWDHITDVHDSLYDELSNGHRVVFRHLSHLVLEIMR